MSRQAEKYMLAHLVEPQDPGFEFNRWPLHVTLVPWFEVESGQFESIDRALGQLAASFVPFEIEATRKAQFGKNNDVPVTLVKNPNDQLQNLHKDVLKVFKNNNFSPEDTRYLGDNYSPHITTRGEREFAPGTEHMVDSITLVKAMEEYVEQPKRRKIIKTYNFIN